MPVYGRSGSQSRCVTTAGLVLVVIAPWGQRGGTWGAADGGRVRAVLAEPAQTPMAAIPREHRAHDLTHNLAQFATLGGGDGQVGWAGDRGERISGERGSQVGVELYEGAFDAGARLRAAGGQAR